MPAKLSDHLTDVLQQLLASLAHLKQVEKRVAAGVTQALAELPPPRLPEPPILPETTPLAILQWIWPQVELEARLEFLIEQLTPKERLVIQVGLDAAEVEDEPCGS